MRGTQAVATYDDLYGMGLVKRNYLALAVKRVIEQPRFDGHRMILTRDLDRGIAWGFSLLRFSSTWERKRTASSCRP